jgi:putative spermidine/putrescine transport system substrate-binding protein
VFVKGAMAGVASIATLGATVRRSAAAGQVLVLDSGAQWQEAAKIAFYDPFERETGIKVIYTSGQTMGVAQLRAMAQTGRAEFDAINLSWFSLLLAGLQGYLEPLDYSVIKTDAFIPGATDKYALGLDTFATIFAYDHEKFPDPQKAPKTWADFWDVKRFPGRRGMGNRPIIQLESALLADGVPLDKLYPMDIERAYRKLGELKPHVVWWMTNAQQGQFMADRAVELILGLNGRLFAAIEKGAPFTLVWNQGLYDPEGWGVPKGAPNKAEAMKFLAYTARPEPQAIFARYIAYGPVNREAYKFISPERAKVLPTYPENLEKMRQVDDLFWAQNGPAMERQWAEWRVK